MSNDLGDANTQTAPYPDDLARMVKKLTYRPGWQAWLADEDRGQDSAGLTLTILVVGPNSYPPHEEMRVRHLFPVPPAAYDFRSWRRWLLNCFLQVESHEACEWFAIDGEKPYAPSHGFGQDPYLIREIGTELDQKMSFRNEVNS